MRWGPAEAAAATHVLCMVDVSLRPSCRHLFPVVAVLSMPGRGQHVLLVGRRLRAQCGQAHPCAVVSVQPHDQCSGLTAFRLAFPRSVAQICRKQYQFAHEMEEHLSSYDHHHRKRLAETRAMLSERNKKEREKKERRRAEKEAARMAAQ